MRSVLLCSLIGILLAGAFGEHSPDDDFHLKKYVEDCLADTGLNISILGITKINDLHEESFEALQYLEEEKRNCFVACVFQKRGIITVNGTLTERLPKPDPNKTFATTFENAVDTCRAKKKFCKLGGCLYGVYF